MSATIFVVKINVLFTLLSVSLVQGLNFQRKVRYFSFDISQLTPKILVFSISCFMINGSPRQFSFIVRD